MRMCPGLAGTSSAGGAVGLGELNLQSQSHLPFDSTQCHNTPYCLSETRQNANAQGQSTEVPFLKRNGVWRVFTFLDLPSTKRK